MPAAKYGGRSAGKLLKHALKLPGVTARVGWTRDNKRIVRTSNAVWCPSSFEFFVLVRAVSMQPSESDSMNRRADTACHTQELSFNALCAWGSDVLRTLAFTLRSFVGNVCEHFDSCYSVPTDM